MIKWVLRLYVVFWLVAALGVLGSTYWYKTATDVHLVMLIVFALISLYYYSRIRATNIMRAQVIDRQALAALFMYESIGALLGFFFGIVALFAMYYRLFEENLPLFG